MDVRTLPKSIFRLFRGSSIDQYACIRDLDRMHADDPTGDPIHLVLGCLGMVLLVGPPSATEFAWVPLLVFSMLRMKHAARVWIHAIGQPVVLMALVLGVWMSISLIWSSDPGQGFEHIAELRWFLVGVFVLPCLHRRGLLIAFLSIGFLIGHLVQIMDMFDGFGVSWIEDALKRDPRRMSGWWDPAVSGSLIVGALGIHLPAAIASRGVVRGVGILGVLISLVALLMTGTRSGWIAGVLLIFVGLWIYRDSLGSRKLWVGAALAGMAIVSSIMIIPSTRARVEETHSEFIHAMSGDLDSFTGARISMGAGAIRAGFAHPFAGVGAGGYRTWMEHDTETTMDNAAHAHSMVPHTFAELGIAGVIMLSMLGLAMLMTTKQHSMRERELNPWGRYHDGPWIAMIGLIIVSAFDSVLINAQSAALIGTLCGISLLGVGRGRLDFGSAQRFADSIA